MFVSMNILVAQKLQVKLLFIQWHPRNACQPGNLFKPWGRFAREKWWCQMPPPKRDSMWMQHIAKYHFAAFQKDPETLKKSPNGQFGNATSHSMSRVKVTPFQRNPPTLDRSYRSYSMWFLSLASSPFRNNPNGVHGNPLRVSSQTQSLRSQQCWMWDIFFFRFFSRPPPTKTKKKPETNSSESWKSADFSKIYHLILQPFFLVNFW